MAAKKDNMAAPVISDKKKALETAMQQIEKMYGKGSIMRYGDGGVTNVECIPTGSLALDLALGIGGLPRGRVIEIYDRAKFADGLVPFNFPTRGTQKGAAYTLCYLLMYGDYVMWHNDIPWLKERIPGLRQTVAALDGYSRADGLLV